MNWTTERCEIPGTIAALRMLPDTGTPMGALAIWMGDHWLTWVGAGRAVIAAADVEQWCEVPLWAKNKGAA